MMETASVGQVSGNDNERIMSSSEEERYTTDTLALSGAIISQRAR